MFDDWDLIEASFAQQYGIRLRHTSMQWTEFTSLLSALNYKTPLGAVISVRTETDQQRLKNFTPEQRKMRSEWQKRVVKDQLNRNPDGAKQKLGELQRAFSAAFKSK